MALRMFILSSAEDSACAEQIIHGCEASGYQIRPQSLQLQETATPINQEQMISESAVCILLWGQAASQSEEVKRLLLFAQRLQKDIIVLTLDATPLPTTLAAVKTLAIQQPYNHCIDQISLLLPPIASQDALQGLTEQTSQPSPTVENNSIFGVRCKNGHVSYFDKRYVCTATYPVPRRQIQSAGKELDELILSCTTCGVAIVAHVDCEGYR